MRRSAFLVVVVAVLTAGCAGGEQERQRENFAEAVREHFPDISQARLDELGESVCTAVREDGIDGQLAANAMLVDTGMEDLDAGMITAHALAGYCPELMPEES